MIKCEKIQTKLKIKDIMRKKKINLCLDLIHNNHKQEGLQKLYYFYYKKIFSIAKKIVICSFYAQKTAKKFFEYLETNSEEIPCIKDSKKWIKEKVTEIACDFKKEKNKNLNSEIFPEEAKQELAIISAGLTEREKLFLWCNDFDIDATHSHDTNQAGTTNGNLQPYITCYMWKRIG